MLNKSISRAACVLLVLSAGRTGAAQDTKASPDRVAALEQQVQRHLQEQKPQLAIPLLREIVALDPGNINGQANLGVLLFFQGSYAEALPPMRAALELRPDLWRIRALFGIAEKRTGDPAASLSDLEQAFPKLDDTKIQIQAGLELIELDSAAARFDKALSVVVKLQELAPRDPQILLAAHHLARQLMDESVLTLMTAAPDSAETHMVLAAELARQGDHTGAIAQYREAIRLNPKLPGVHFELAEQLRSSPDPAMNAQAAAAYQAALAVNPYDELSWRQLAGVLAANGDFKTAAEDYKKALALQPKDSDAEAGMAIVLISTNRTSEAISLLESAEKDDPTNLVAHYRLSVLYRRAGRAADADRELASFHHYEDVKKRLTAVSKQLVGR